MNITLGIPFQGGINGATVGCLLQLVSSSPGMYHYAFISGSNICDNRNTIVDWALKQGTSHLLFIDQDMLFGPRDLPKLIAADKDIIGANYHRKEQSRENLVLLEDEKGVTYHPKELPKELFTCYAIPTGFSLIKTDVFRKLEKPWFFYRWAEGSIDRVTEDVCFCEKARAAGYEVWCDPSIELGHIGTFVY